MTPLPPGRGTEEPQRPWKLQEKKKRGGGEESGPSEGPRAILQGWGRRQVHKEETVLPPPRLALETLRDAEGVNQSGDIRGP